jgi:hypothetical protein
VLGLMPAACTSVDNPTRNGCFVQQTPAHWTPADVVLTGAPQVGSTATPGSGAPTTVTIERGQSLDLDMTSSIQWTLSTPPAAGVLATVQPAGWYNASIHACVWRFVAADTGSTLVGFTGVALCAPNAACARLTDPPRYRITVA